MDKSMRAEVLPLKIRQVKPIRIHLLRDAPLIAVLVPSSMTTGVDLKVLTTGVDLKVLAALASGDGDRDVPGAMRAFIEFVPSPRGLLWASVSRSQPLDAFTIEKENLISSTIYQLLHL
jgi:hypothetical protein